MQRFSAFVALVFLLVCCPVVSANITLAKIFSDHMVLQRNSSVKVWGTADPQAKLIVKFNGQTMNATADIQGRWSTSIRTPQAGGPYEIEVTQEGGEPKIVISDVMIGEVWICSGQSNMAWEVEKALNPEAEIEASKNYPNIRMFKIGRESTAQELSEFSKITPWNCCSPETVKGFSAVGYYFGRELSEKLDIPIGLIETTWGGTRCEAWTPRGELEKVPELAPLLRQWDESEDITNRHRPANLYNAMVSPMVGFNFRGVIWYQGEANVGRGDQYSVLFPTMIQAWRKQLAADREFPFYYVQIAPFRYEGRSKAALSEVRDAQFKTLFKLDTVGMAITSDLGNPADIHPKNKQEVGRRLSLWALAKTYQKDLGPDKQVQEFSGPLFESISMNEKEIRVSFTHAKGGLVARDDQPLSGFTICGEDKAFVPAEARIDGEAVVVSAEGVTNPVAVRFAWDDTDQPNLVNRKGLPASPFRTDSFELESKGVDY